MLTWYSTMASLKSSARSLAAITSPSLSVRSAEVEGFDRLRNLSLILSRALRILQHGQQFIADWEHQLEQGFPPPELIGIPRGVPFHPKTTQPRADRFYLFIGR